MYIRLAPQPRELVSGVDALYLSASASCPGELGEGLAEARGSAQAIGSAVPYWFGGQEFELQPHGRGRYPYLLTFDGGWIGINVNGTIPPFRFQPRAEFLHGEGADTVARWFEGLLLGEELGLVIVTVSRLDVYADFEGLPIEVTDLPNFVTRARSRRSFEEDEQWTGFEFGRRKTGTICSRVYDKTAELRVKRAGYWEEIWGRPIEGEPVTRVEFEFASGGLGEFGVSHPSSAIAAAGSLWAWASDRWLRLCVPTGDQTKRWPVDDRWRAVQLASVAEQAQGLDRMRNAARRVDLRFHGTRLVGQLATVAALMGTGDLEGTLELVPTIARGVEKQSRRTFQERVAEKATRE